MTICQNLVWLQIPSEPKYKKSTFIMKACMLAYTYYEEDNRVRRYAETLIENGWDVTVIALDNTGKNSPSYLKGVKIQRIQRRSINEKTKFDYFYKILKFSILSFLILTKKCFKEKIDLIHVHSVPDFLVFSTLIPKIFGTRIILDIHDIVPELYCAKFRKTHDSIIFKILLAVEKLSAMFSDHLIIANHIWGDRIVKRSTKASKCSVILNYPDETIFNKSVNSKHHDNYFTIMYPGALSKHQGLDIAIKAVDLIKEEIPQLKFEIYGSGTDEKYLKKLVNELDLGDIITFHDSVSLELIAEKMASADLGIEPKLKDGFSNEAFSTKILEFMMLGVPVVISDTSAHTRYIESSTAKFFRAGNIEELADCIKLFYNSISLRGQYTTKAEQFMRKMNWGAKKIEYLHIVSNLTQRP